MKCKTSGFEMQPQGSVQCFLFLIEYCDEVFEIVGPSLQFGVIVHQLQWQ